LNKDKAEKNYSKRKFVQKTGKYTRNDKARVKDRQRKISKQEMKEEKEIIMKEKSRYNIEEE
jgi:hypothetical protein